jgi:hypothetical protein
MREIKGVVELHGESIEVGEGNNEQYVKIDGISPYDFEGVILNQSELWKIDLINVLCADVGIDKINGLYSKSDMEKCWDKASIYSDELSRIKRGESNFQRPLRDSKEAYFKDKK